ncbi:uncharacterized protein Dsimw501_GD27397 [Drosophila simulans]|nr:uncharacterized protein Dsimw501_GD27397 [Drosophila simulans]
MVFEPAARRSLPTLRDICGSLSRASSKAEDSKGLGRNCRLIKRINARHESAASRCAGRPTEATGASAKCDTGGRSTHKGHWDATKSNNEILRRGVAEFLDLSHIFKPKFARCPSQLVRPGAAGEDYKRRKKLTTKRGTSGTQRNIRLEDGCLPRAGDATLWHGPGIKDSIPETGRCSPSVR